jgi:eukaryotic-like serine/threonine-protein kinase
MGAPATVEEYMSLVRTANLVDEKRLDPRLWEVDPEELPKSPPELADFLVQAGVLTGYQAVQVLKGKVDFFEIGPFRVLERLGHGMASNVYYCEDKRSKQHVAVKVLTQLKAQDEVALKRFYREARAAARLQHPNIVRVRDVDHDRNDNHYMVMDYVDGASLQDIVQRTGIMDPIRAAHYIRQTAEGLQYAHQAGLVHRDIKPANLLIDRKGAVKILDMGLARFSQEEGDPLTRGEILGQPEYLAPEQGHDSHNVDIRADIYSLGATFYFLLMGEPPYAEEKTLAKKLLAKTQRPPKPMLESRPDLPPELVAVIEKMMAVDPKKRYPTPIAVAEALSPWTEAAIPPPPEREMPTLSPAARGVVKPGKSAQGTADKKAGANNTQTAKTTQPMARPQIPATTTKAGGPKEEVAKRPVKEARKPQPKVAVEDEEDEEEEEEQESEATGGWSALHIIICVALVGMIGALAWVLLHRGA